MKRTLGSALSVIAGLAVMAPAGGLGATSGVGTPEPDKPLGTLWYPGPYAAPPQTAPTPAPAPGPVIRPVIRPVPRPATTPVTRPAPVPVPAPAAVGAPEPEKPLGTLWYPGAYDPMRPPSVAPPPRAVERVRQAAPPAPRVRPPLARPIEQKPLGTLWYPGPYNADRPAVPVPVPAEAPGEATPAPTQRATGSAPAAPDTGGQPSDDPSSAPPVHLNADTMSYDRENGIITASGNVEIIHGGRRLVADRIVYNQNTDAVRAEGNVQLTEPDGERIFADRSLISGDLKDAVVESIGIILTDRSRLAAVGARRSGGVITEMRKGVYSPCNLCEDDPSSPPLWQVKAVKVIHDKNDKIIEYRDAWLEVKGIPVAYTPYFSHPDPTVKRKTGFLAPSIGGSSDLGTVAVVPYFINLSPHSDATVTAIVTGEEGSGATAEYRRRFEKGTFDVTASLIGGDSEDDVRGHIEGAGRFDVNDTWRWGFDVHRATDDTYLRRYGFVSPDTLRTRLFTEGFRRRNYFTAEAYAFQGLRAEDDPGLEPIVLPMMDYNHLGEPDRFGGQTVLDVNLLALTRGDGSDTRRLSIRPGWQLPMYGPLGDVYKLSVGLNADLYHVDTLTRPGQTDFTGFSARVVPEVMLDWRFPLVRSRGPISQIVEPVAVAVYTPYGGNPDTIPNEDSIELEFDDTNLFSANKFSGIDRVEGGPRVGYGIKWGVYGSAGGKSTFFIGQSWRPKIDDTYATGSGLEERFSDLVGRAHISPGPYLNLLYRTRFASDNLSPKRNEFQFSAGAPALRVGTNYAFIEQQQDSEFAGREELNFNVSSQFNRFWRGNFSGTRDMVAGEMRRFGAQVVYENECVIFTTNLSRTFFEDRDLEPTDSVTFNVVLKTLGEIRADAFTN